MQDLSEYQGNEMRFVPKYELLRRLLLDYIMHLPPDQEYLPYEEELAKEFGVCRRTVSRALAKLRRGGYIETMKKSGSRILKRSIDAHRPAPRREGTTGTVAFLLANDTDSPRYSGIRWELLNRIETEFLSHGIRLVSYNLRENQWQAWCPEKLMASLKENGISWVITYPETQKDYPYHELYSTIQKNKFKLIFYIQDISDDTQHNQLCPCADFVGGNTLRALEETLNDKFREETLLLYLSNNLSLRFAERRTYLIRNFAKRHAIPFHYLNYEQDFSTGKAFVKNLRERIRGREKTVCFIANDAVAEQILAILQSNHFDRNKLDIIGFDNNQIFAQKQYSTFDFNLPAIAKALFTRYQEYLRDPSGALAASAGIITYPRFIDRRNHIERK